MNHILHNSIVKFQSIQMAMNNLMIHLILNIHSYMISNCTIKWKSKIQWIMWNKSKHLTCQENRVWNLSPKVKENCLFMKDQRLGNRGDNLR